MFPLKSSTYLLIALFSQSILMAQFDDGTEGGGTIAGDDRSGATIAGDDRAGSTESGGARGGVTLSGDPGWDAEPPREEGGDPPGTGSVPDTFDEHCSYDLSWNRSQGGTGGGGNQFLEMDMNYNDDGAGGPHRICLNMTMDITSTQTLGVGQALNFVINNGSAVNEGSDPATNAMIVVDPNGGLSIYEYDVNPAGDYGGPGDPAFADPIFDTAQTADLLNATVQYGAPVFNNLTGQWTQEISVCWDNAPLEDHFEDMGVDPLNVRPDEKVGLWARSWGGIDIDYSAPTADGGQHITGWDPAWPSDAELENTNGFMDFVGPTDVTKVPEPSGISLLLLSAMFGLKHRRRKLS